MSEKEFYRKKICEMIDEITNLSFLKRIYQLAEYLYIHKESKYEGK